MAVFSKRREATTVVDASIATVGDCHLYAYYSYHVSNNHLLCTHSNRISFRPTIFLAHCASPPWLSSNTTLPDQMARTISECFARCGQETNKQAQPYPSNPIPNQTTQFPKAHHRIQAKQKPDSGMKHPLQSSQPQRPYAPPRNPPPPQATANPLSPLQPLSASSSSPPSPSYQSTTSAAKNEHVICTVSKNKAKRKTPSADPPSA